MRRIFVLLFTVSALCFKKINEEESCANPLRMASIGSTPVLLYSDSMHGQTVQINYSRCIGENAKRVQIMIYMVMQNTDTTNAITVKLQNELQFHYHKMLAYGYAQKPASNSQEYSFSVTQSRKVTLSMDISLGTINQYLQIICTGYYI